MCLSLTIICHRARAIHARLCKHFVFAVVHVHRGFSHYKTAPGFTRMRHLYDSYVLLSYPLFKVYAVIDLVLAGSASFSCALTLIGTFDDIFVALLADGILNIINKRAAVMMVVVRDHASGKMNSDLILLDIRLLKQLLAEVL